MEFSVSTLTQNILLEGTDGTFQEILNLYIPSKFGKSGKNPTLIYSDGKEYTLNNKTNTNSIIKVSNEANVNDE